MVCCEVDSPHSRASTAVGQANLFAHWNFCLLIAAVIVVTLLCIMMPSIILVCGPTACAASHGIQLALLPGPRLGLSVLW